MNEITFIENPVVGQKYDVPCVRSINDARRWLAVLPLKHSDPMFGIAAAAEEHYHYDLRFFSDDLMNIEFRINQFDKWGGRANAITAPAFTKNIRILSKKCFREFTGIYSTEGVKKLLPKKNSRLV